MSLHKKDRSVKSFLSILFICKTKSESVMSYSREVLSLVVMMILLWMKPTACLISICLRWEPSLSRHQVISQRLKDKIAWKILQKKLKCQKLGALWVKFWKTNWLRPGNLSKHKLRQNLDLRLRHSRCSRNSQSFLKVCKIYWHWQTNNSPNRRSLVLLQMIRDLKLEAVRSLNLKLIPSYTQLSQSFSNYRDLSITV